VRRSYRRGWDTRPRRTGLYGNCVYLSWPWSYCTSKIRREGRSYDTAAISAKASGERFLVGLRRSSSCGRDCADGLLEVVCMVAAFVSRDPAPEPQPPRIRAPAAAAGRSNRNSRGAGREARGPKKKRRNLTWLVGSSEAEKGTRAGQICFQDFLSCF
jgi:hypothetical protein